MKDKSCRRAAALADVLLALLAVPVLAAGAAPCFTRRFGSCPPMLSIVPALVILGAMASLLNPAGGSAAFVRWAQRSIKARAGAQPASVVTMFAQSFQLPLPAIVFAIGCLLALATGTIWTRRGQSAAM